MATRPVSRDYVLPTDLPAGFRTTHLACVWCHQDPHRIDVRAASPEEVDAFLKTHEGCEPDQDRRRPTWRGR